MDQQLIRNFFFSFGSTPEMGRRRRPELNSCVSFFRRWRERMEVFEFRRRASGYYFDTASIDFVPFFFFGKNRRTNF
ncbi:Protein CBG27046 [Caenorhabditis briggsae]|uniref:Protein CBG27046 n=1 Tax=Caenorhabditis briggsae TaxID=6238 RepID=B6IMB0_CAEBR|nr:Protein CBG27046 [Caenorhabditis briggsae]CAS01040.1 Protein CBG27046 [Caenorhabditis briggsae]